MFFGSGSLSSQLSLGKIPTYLLGLRLCTVSKKYLSKNLPNLQTKKGIFAQEISDNSTADDLMKP